MNSVFQIAEEHIFVLNYQHKVVRVCCTEVRNMLDIDITEEIRS